MAVMGDFDHTFKSNTKIGTTTSVFRPVYLLTNGFIDIADTATQKPIGILMKKPLNVTGAACWVRLGGIGKVQLADTVGTGDLLMASTIGASKATGQTINSDTATTVGANLFTIGEALEFGNHTAAIISILIAPKFFTIPQIASAIAGNTLTTTIP